MERLDKILSKSNVLSRKDTLRYVKSGRIKVDGSPVSSPNVKVRDDASVEIDGALVELYRPVLLALNKKEGYVTTTSSSEGPNVMELLPEKYIRLSLKPVGRLDKDTSGLLLFTNDGDLLHRLISPKKEIEKEYLVTHKGRVTDEIIASFASGLVLGDGTVLKPAVLTPVEDGKSRLIIREGKYHQVKRMMGSLGLEVTALERIRIGSLTLSGLERGEVREVDVEQLFN